MSVYEMAKKYYPVLWDIDRIRQLVEAKRLTSQEGAEITGEEFSKIESKKED